MKESHNLTPVVRAEGMAFHTNSSCRFYPEIWLRDPIPPSAWMRFRNGKTIWKSGPVWIQFGSSPPLRQCREASGWPLHAVSYRLDRLLVSIQSSQDLLTVLLAITETETSTSGAVYLGLLIVEEATVGERGTTSLLLAYVANTTKAI